MMHRILIVFCATLLLALGPTAHPADAQQMDPTYRQLTVEASRLVRPAALMKRGRTPARVDSLEGPPVVAVGETVPFQAYTNAEYAALPVAARWSFGDGAAASGLSARHRFDVPGMYTVTFAFANRHGVSRDTVKVRVESPRVER